MKSAEQQLAELKRGTIQLETEKELLAKLQKATAQGKPLRVKAGFDPTAPDLHLGHTVLMSKMRQFQDLGHTAIFLVGDFTAQIGDPTGKNTTRPQLSREEIQDNAQTYITQAMKILDPHKTEIRYNSGWMNKMNAAEIIRLAAKATVGQMRVRPDFKKREALESPISIHEFLYPLVQAYDSVMLEADVELGGHDQLFNLQMGRQIQKAHDQPEQCILMMPLLEGIDAKLDQNGKLLGKKMSKSYNNYVGIDESPEQIYGKLMSISDALMWRYYELLSRQSIEHIQTHQKAMSEGNLHPMDAKKQLAQELVQRFHDTDAAQAAAQHFERTVVRKNLEDDLQDIELPLSDEGMTLLIAIHELGFAPSRSQARRLVQQGAVSLDGEKQNDPHLTLQPGSYILKAGKRKYCRLHLKTS